MDATLDWTWALVGWIRGDFDEIHVDCVDYRLPPIDPCAADPRCRRASAWSFDHWGTPDDETDDFRAWLHAVAAAGPFSAARFVNIDSGDGISGDCGLRSDIGNFATIARAFPAVEELGVRGVWTLAEPIELLQLRRLYVDAAEIDTCSATALLTSAMPRVSHLRALFCELGSARVAQSALLALFARHDLRALRKVTVAGAELEHDFLIAVAATPLLAQLERLCIERCTVIGVPTPLGPLARRFAHLERLVLPEDLWCVEFDAELPHAGFTG